MTKCGDDPSLLRLTAGRGSFCHCARRVMLLLSWTGFGSAVSRDCVALPSTIDKDQSFEMLPLVMYNWWLWSSGKLDPPLTLCDRPSRTCVRLVMPLLMAIEKSGKSEGKCCSSSSPFLPSSSFCSLRCEREPRCI